MIQIELAVYLLMWCCYLDRAPATIIWLAGFTRSEPMSKGSVNGKSLP